MCVCVLSILRRLPVFCRFIGGNRDSRKTREKKELKNREVRKYTTFVVRGRQTTDYRGAMSIAMWMMLALEQLLLLVWLLRAICARDRSNMLFSAGKRDFPFQPMTTTIAWKMCCCAVCEARASESISCVWFCQKGAEQSRWLAHTPHHSVDSMVIDSHTREQYLLFLLFGWMRWKIMETRNGKK